MKAPLKQIVSVLSPLISILRKGSRNQESSTAKSRAVASFPPVVETLSSVKLNGKACRLHSQPHSQHSRVNDTRNTFVVTVVDNNYRLQSSPLDLSNIISFSK